MYMFYYMPQLHCTIIPVVRLCCQTLCSGDNQLSTAEYFIAINSSEFQPLKLQHVWDESTLVG